MAQKKLQATATLFLDTSNAQSDAKKFVNDIKQKLAEVETAADKMSVFKDVVGYIAQIDRALTALKAKNADVFNSAFGSLDIDLKRQLEGIFGIDGVKLGQLDVLREKLNNLTPKSSIDEIRNFAKTMNNVFESIGLDIPFPDIKKTFAEFNKEAKAGHIETLKTKLLEFATVWEDVTTRMSGGFGVGGSSAGGITSSIEEQRKAMQEEIDRLREQKDEYQELLDVINGKKVKVKTSKKTDVEQLQELINKFNEAQGAVKDFEKANNTSGDGYRQALAEAYKMAVLLKNTMDYVSELGSDAGANFVAKNLGTGGAYSEAEKLLNNFKNSSQFNDVLSHLKQKIEDIGTAIEAQYDKFQKLNNPGDADKVISLYDQLYQKAKEYLEIRRRINEVDKVGNPDLYKNLSKESARISSEIEQLKPLDEDMEDLLYDVFDEANQDGAQLSTIVEKLCNIFQVEIPQAASQASTATGTVFSQITDDASKAGEAVSTFGKKIINISEYVSALSGQLKEMFAATGRSANFEYHIAIDGLDIKARHGSEKSVDLATQTGTYLDTLFSDSVIYGHSHRGGTAITNLQDIESVLSSYRDGVSIPVHFVVGKDAITTIDFTGLSKDMVDKLRQEIAATNNNKELPVQNEVINKIVEKFTGKSGALKTWNVTQFDDLAKYLYDVSEAASSALTPIEKFQAVLDNMFGKGRVDASKYESLLPGLNKDNAKSIFNRIASAEKLPTIDQTDMLTMGQVNAEIDESIAKYKALREEANLSYSDIRKEVDRVIEHYESGGSVASELDFFKQYFPEGEWQNVRDLLTDAYDGLISIEEVTNRIANEFAVDPDTFAKIPTGIKTLQDDNVKAKLEEFLALADKMQHENLYGSAENNVDIGRYIERLEIAKTELEALGAQGLITAEDLEKVNIAFAGAKSHLEDETSHYDSFYSGPSYDYYDEYKEQQERAETAEGENTRLQRQLETMRQLSDIDKQIGLIYDNNVDELDGLIEDRKALLDIAESTNSLSEQDLQTQRAITQEYEERSKFIHDGYDKAERDFNLELSYLNSEDFSKFSIDDINKYIDRLDVLYTKLQEAYNNNLMGDADTFFENIEGPYTKAISHLEEAKLKFAKSFSTGTEPKFIGDGAPVNVSGTIDANIVSDQTNIAGKIQDAQNAIVTAISNMDGKDTPKQDAIEEMKQTLTKVINRVVEHDNQIVDFGYTQQELTGSLFADGKFALGYGEDGFVHGVQSVYKRLSNILSPVIMDLHTHPFDNINGRGKGVADIFSTGDFKSFEYEKFFLNSQLQAMISGNIMTVLDMGKMSIQTYSKFMENIKAAEQKLVEQYPDRFVLTDDGEMGIVRSKSDEERHETMDIVHSQVRKALFDAGVAENDLFDTYRQYNLTNDSDLTELATHLVELSSAATPAADKISALRDLLISFGSKNIKQEAENLLERFNSEDTESFERAEILDRLKDIGTKYFGNDLYDFDNIEKLFKDGKLGDVSTIWKNIINNMGKDIESVYGEAALKSLSKGERTLTDVWNDFANVGYRVEPERLEKYEWFSGTEPGSVEQQLLSQIITIISSIDTKLVSIESNTRKTISDQLNEAHQIFTSGNYDKILNNTTSRFNPRDTSMFQANALYKDAKKAISIFTSDFNDATSRAVYDGDVSVTEVYDLIQRFNEVWKLLNDALLQVELYERNVSPGTSYHTEDALTSSFEINGLMSRFKEDISAPMTMLINYARQALQQPLSRNNSSILRPVEFDDMFEYDEEAETYTDKITGEIFEALHRALDQFNEYDYSSFYIDEGGNIIAPGQYDALYGGGGIDQFDLLHEDEDIGKDNVIQTIQQTLVQILAILQGFTGLEADGKNSLTHKEATVKIPTNTINATEQLTSKLSDIATENTLSQIFTAINSLADTILSKKEIAESSGILTENAHYLTDFQGNPMEMYRGIREAIGGLVSNRDHGGTFFTDSIELAKRYAGINGKVDKANISMKNPLEIDANGHQWNDLLYIGRGADEASKKIHQLRADIKELEMQLNSVFDEYGEIDDIDLHSKLTDDLNAKRNELKSIYDDPTNPYGKYDTNGLVEYAKSAGYDGVIFKNIKDGTNEISNIVVTLQENQIHFIETLKTSFESLLTDFIGYFGKIEDFMSHYNKFRTDNSPFPEIKEDGRVIFGEQLAKYEELSMLGKPEIIKDFLNKNKILGAYDKREPGGLDALLNMESVDERIDAIVEFYLNAIYELEKIQEAFNTKATSVEQYRREKDGNLTSYDKISKVKPGYNDKKSNDGESYKYADTTIEDLNSKKDKAIAAANAFRELFASIDIRVAEPEQIKSVVDSFVNTIKLIDDAQNMAAGIVENSSPPDLAAMRDFHELGPIRDSLTADYLDILQAEAQKIEQVEIDMQKAQTDAISDAGIQLEISQLNQLSTTLTEVKNAVIAKTKAFVDEGNVVGQVVGKEIAALKNLSVIVDSIAPKVKELVDGLKKIDAAKLNGTMPEANVGSNVETPGKDPFKAKLTAQKGAFTKYSTDIKEADYLTEDLEKQLDSLRVSLGEVTNQSGLDDWVKRFNNLKEIVKAVKSEFEQINLGTVNVFQKELTNSFNKLTLPQKEEMLKEYFQAIILLNQQKQAVQEGHAVELEGIKKITEALQEKINAQIEANKAAKTAATAQKKNGNFGSTASINATAKYNSLSKVASSGQFANSSEVAAIMTQYEQAYKHMMRVRDEVRNKDVIDDSDREVFKQATTECNNYASALDKLVKSTMKLKGAKANPDDYMLGSDFDYSNIEQRKAALEEFVQQTYGLKVAAEDFEDGWNKVVFAVDNGDGTFTQMTATFTDARNEIVALAGDTKKVQTAFQSFIDGFKGRVKSLAQYFLATVSIYDVLRVAKQGAQYVKEIDSALTELKKVTDETDASYNQFLQDMSKTGSVIGATVKDLTLMASEWARLGYSMEEAGKLAESTAILMNVSEFDDATSASEALISTMQAFQYTADESGHVVDVLNEVGNNYAVSSDGLAIALQDSASALMEGGNNLEQAVALVAAANRVVQDPNSVGAALRTISLRLRGTSVEVLQEMGEETEGVVEGVSKLQAKIKALSGVDILTNAGSYKDTYTILKEIGAVWEDMDDMDQAALLELMAGKNRANTLSAILSNMEDLEGAYNDALNAEGSALKENEAYLDSIQGRIDIFNNTVQTMWMNFIDSEAVKFIVDLGTALIKLVDTIGLIPTAVGVFAGYKILAKDLSNLFGNTTVSAKQVRKELYNYITAQNQSVNASTEAAGAKQAETEATNAAAVADKNETKTSEANSAANKEQAKSANEVAASKSTETTAVNASVAADEKDVATSTASGAADKQQAQSAMEVTTAKTAEAGAVSTATSADVAEIPTSTTNAAVNKQQAKSAMEVTTAKIAEANAVKNAAVQDAKETGTSIANAGANGKQAATGVAGTTGNAIGNTVGTIAGVAGAAGKVVSTGSKALTVVKTLGKSLGKIGLIIMAVELATKLLGAAWDWIDEKVHRVENLREELEELKNTYEEAKKTFDDNLEILTTSSDSKTYATLQDEFAALAAGVDKYGNNISLTSDEYERYRDICEDIAGVNPDLAKGYDDVTTAIGNNVNILSELIELQKMQRRQNVRELFEDENLDTYAGNAFETIDDIKTNIRQTETSMETKDTMNNLLSQHFLASDYIINFGTGEDAVENSIRTTLEKLGYTKENIDKIMSEYFLEEVGGYDSTKFFADYMQEIFEESYRFEGSDGVNLVDNFFDHIKDEFEIDYSLIIENYKTYNEKLNGYNEDLKDAQGIFIDTLLQFPFGEKAYYGMNDASKNMLVEWIKNSEIFKIDPNATEKEMRAQLESNIETIRGMIEKISSEETQPIFAELGNLDPSSMSAKDYSYALGNIVNKFFGAIGGAENEYGLNYRDIQNLFGFNVDLLKEFDAEKKIIESYFKTNGLDVNFTDFFNLSTMTQAEVDTFLGIDWNAIGAENVKSVQDVWNIIRGEMNKQRDAGGIGTYSSLSTSADSYDSIQAQTDEILHNGIQVTKEYKDALIELGIAEQDLAECFDENNPLIVKNSAALKDLVEESKDSVAQNVKMAKSHARLKYLRLAKELNEICGSTEDLTSAQKLAASVILDQMDTVETAIYKYTLLEDKLLGTHNAFEKFNEGKEVDSLETYSDSYVEMAQTIYDAYYKTGEVGTEAVNAAVEAMIDPKRLAGLERGTDAYNQAVFDIFSNEILPTFTLDGDSISLDIDSMSNFINSGLGKIFDGTGPKDFSLKDKIMIDGKAVATDLESVAKAMGMTETQAYAMFAALKRYTGKDYLSMLDDSTEGRIMNTTQKLTELNKQKLELLADGGYEKNKAAIDALNKKILELTANLAELRTKAKGDLIEYENNEDIIAKLGELGDLAKLTGKDLAGIGFTSDQKALFETEMGLTFDQASAEEIFAWIIKRQEEIGEPTVVTVQYAIEANEAKIDRLKQEIEKKKQEIEKQNEKGIPISTELTIEISDLEAQIDALEQQNEEWAITYNITNEETVLESIKTIDSQTIGDKTFNVICNDQATSKLRMALNLIRELKDTVLDLGLTISGRAGANGTAHALGTALKSGSWGAPRTETALVGELGPELLVRGNRWTTIGENGAEFTNIRKGDIIFNHKQTEDLLSKGYISGRGRMAGGAFASGTAYNEALWYPVAKDNEGSSSDGSLSGSKDDEFEEIFDWFEVLLEEINEQLDLMNAKLENAVGIGAKGSLIDQLLNTNHYKIYELAEGIKLYTDYAAKLLQKVPAQYRAMAQDGSVAITEFLGEANEETVEAINNYREWAQKVADLNQQLEETKTEIADLAKQKFDVVVDEYDNIISILEAQRDQFDAQISLMEDRGYVAAKVYYESMIQNTRKQSGELEKQKKAMQAVLDEQVRLGNIKVGSEQWYEMIEALYDVDSSIKDCVADLEEYQNALNDIHWENFENLTNRLDYLKEETQSLIDLMDSEDMVITPETDDGWSADQVEWSREGMASLGLYAQQMEIAEYTARQYAEAIDDLNADFKAGKYSESEYQEKLEELTSAQYDSIEAYYDAQEAIQDLHKTRVDSIKEGIEKEIEAYEKLIQKKKEELDADKDLYDFEKSVADQQKNISDIERKLAALSVDNSMSAMAKRKQLEAELAEARASLEESYHDRSVTDQQNALDKELENYKEEKDAEIEKLEEYLEDVKTIVADSLVIIQDNASGIYETLNSKANEYNLTLSDSIVSPWRDGELAVSDYQTAFDTAMSSTTNQLEAMKRKWQELIDKMAKAAQTEISSQQKENNRYVEATPVPTVSNNTTSKAIAVGGKINAGSAPIYADSHGSGASSQYYSSDPIYTVLEEQGGYVLVRHHSLTSGYSGWFKKSDVKGYAKGTTGTKSNELAWIDELGDELVMHADGSGRLSFLSKGTAVIPHDISENLMELGQLDPSDVLSRNTPIISMSPSAVTNNMEVNMSIAEVVHIDTVSNETIPDLTKAIEKQMDKYMKNINNNIRKYAR